MKNPQCFRHGIALFAILLISPLSARTVSTTGGQNSVSVGTSEGPTFFRLAHP